MLCQSICPHRLKNYNDKEDEKANQEKINNENANSCFRVQNIKYGFLLPSTFYPRLFTLDFLPLTFYARLSTFFPRPSTFYPRLSTFSYTLSEFILERSHSNVLTVIKSLARKALLQCISESILERSHTNVFHVTKYFGTKRPLQGIVAASH